MDTLTPQALRAGKGALVVIYDNPDEPSRIWLYRRRKSGLDFLAEVDEADYLPGYEAALQLLEEPDVELLSVDRFALSPEQASAVQSRGSIVERTTFLSVMLD